MGEKLLLLRDALVARCEQLVQYIADCISAKIGETLLFPDFAGSVDSRLHLLAMVFSVTWSIISKRTLL